MNVSKLRKMLNLIKLLGAIIAYANESEQATAAQLLCDPQMLDSDIRSEELHARIIQKLSHQLSNSLVSMLGPSGGLEIYPMRRVEENLFISAKPHITTLVTCTHCIMDAWCAKGTNLLHF